MSAFVVARTIRAPRGTGAKWKSHLTRSIHAMASANHVATANGMTTKGSPIVPGNPWRCGASRKRKHPSAIVPSTSRLSLCLGPTQTLPESLSPFLESPRRSFFSGSHHHNRDWEDQYRRPITPDLWEEFQHEAGRIRDYLSQPPPPTFHEMASELHLGISELWSGPTAHVFEPPPEYGPTGKWTYRFETSPNGTRLYQRSSSSATSTSTTNAVPETETVLELSPEEEVLAMSLTPDEACVACLLQPQDPSSPIKIQLRRVDSTKEATLVGDDWLRGELGGDDDGALELVGLEWGPILPPESNSSQQSHSHSHSYSLYLLLADHQGRPNTVAVCQIDPSLLTVTVPPTLVYVSEDPTVMCDVQRTKGCSFVSIRALSKTSSEVFLSPGSGDAGFSSLTLVRPRQEGVIYHVDVGKEGDIVLLTSDETHPNGGDYVLEETTVGDLPLPTAPSMPPLEGDHPEFFVEDMDLFQSHIVLYERSRKNGIQRVKIRQRDSKDQDKANSKPRDTILDLSSVSGKLSNNSGGHVTLPLYWSKLSPVGNMCFESSFFRFELELPVAPGLVYEYNFDTQQLAMVSGGGGGSGSDSDGGSDVSVTQQLLDPSFRKETVLVESSDGTKVPLTLFYRNEENSGETKSIPQTKTVVLVGYGAYGEPMDLGYNPGWKPLLERGVVVAFAHTRGGGDLGRAWYVHGRREHKVRSIEDYEACAFYLKKRFETQIPITDEEEQGKVSLVAKAFSAGGVVVGAAINRNPGLFDKVVLTNAFVDVASTMSQPSLFLTEHEYDEFGNPQTDAMAKDKIQSYCPIYNLDPAVQAQQTSTRFLLIGTLDDANVPYWNASLYFRKLWKGFSGDDALVAGDCSSNNRIFLELQTHGGHHFSGANRIDVLALETAFILKG